jgi:hypothetical protein
MVVAVVEAVDVEATVVAVVNHLQTLAVLTSTPSLMQWPLRSARGTWRRDSASSATRRDTDCFSARSERARHLWNRQSLRSNDGGKAVLLAN